MHDLFGRSRRRSSSQVSHIIDYRIVGFMSDRGNDRYFAFIYRPCDTLIVKSEEIFIRSSSSCHDDDIDILLFVEIIDACCNFRRTVLTLNARRIQEQVKIRIPLAQSIYDIGDYTAGC